MDNKIKKKDLDNKSKPVSDLQQVKTEKKLTAEEKKLLNRKTNKLLEELAELLYDTNSQNKQRLKKVLNDLGVCANEMQSQFLDDILTIVKAALNLKKGKQNGNKKAK